MKNDLLRIIKSKESELQDLLKRNNELVSREEKLTNENHEIKNVLEKVRMANSYIFERICVNEICEIYWK